jgi:uncharacterized membrane protein
MVASADAVNANDPDNPSALNLSYEVPVLTVPGVTTATVGFTGRAIAPPVIKYNAHVGTTATTNQVAFDVTVTLDVSLTVLGVGLQGSVTVPLTLTAAEADARLDAIKCPMTGNVIDITNTLGGVSIDVDTSAPLVDLRTLPIPPLFPWLPPVPGVPVFRVTTVADPVALHKYFGQSGPDPLVDIAIGETRQHAGSFFDLGSVLLPGSASGNVEVTVLGALSLNVDAVATGLLNVLNPALTEVKNSLDSLFGVLGVSAPAADVHNYDTICGGPFLAG